MRQNRKTSGAVFNYLVLATFLLSSLSAFGQRGKFEEPFVDPLGDTPKTNKNGWYLGTHLGLGQTRSTESDDSPGTAYIVGLDPGYMMTLGSWNRLEIGGEFFFGKASYRLPKADGGLTELPIGMGILAKVGYGYSLGNNLFGVWKIGAGPVQAKYSASPGNQTVESKGAMSGLAGLIELMLILPMYEKLEGIGGFRWTYMEFDLDDVEVDGTTVNAGERVNVNMPMINVGLRLRI